MPPSGRKEVGRSRPWLQQPRRGECSTAGIISRVTSGVRWGWAQHRPWVWQPECRAEEGHSQAWRQEGWIPSGQGSLLSNWPWANTIVSALPASPLDPARPEDCCWDTQSPSLEGKQTLSYQPSSCPDGICGQERPQPPPHN